ncbi:MAG: PhnD/SsuA/transferrin family substrate-binding protein [Pseudomonadota bacterium]
MKRGAWPLWLLILLLPAAPALAFTIGILPVHSSRVLVERYEPLRVYLERSLKQPVRVESAPDFARFQQRTLRGDFDLTITAAHFARMAQKDRGLQPLAQFTPDHDALLIYSARQPLASPADLRGRQLAVIDRLAITVMAALQYLDEQGLEADRDYRVVEHRTHASAAHSLVNGLSSAAVTTSQGLMQIPEDMRARLAVIKHIADIPAFVFLARPDMPGADLQRLRDLLLAFPGEAEGIDFLGHTGYTGLRATSEASMRRADPYLKETRKVLKP